jgi:hypothetical protein
LKICQTCRREVEPPDPVGRKAACPFCRADLRCCLNCLFHEPAACNQCRESQAERVLEKDRANFCDYFHYREGGGSTGGRVVPVSDRLEGLFRKP